MLPLLILVIFIAWQGLVLLHQDSEAEDDARVIARENVICNANATPELLNQIDPSANGGAVTMASGSDQTVVVHVTLPPQSVLGDISLTSLGFPSPSATVTMRHEPC